jgi:DNA polymerase elongation subunit (family B)
LKTVVVDIETVGADFDAYDEATQAYLMRSADAAPSPEEREAARARVLDSLSLWPLTARIVAIAVADVATGQASAAYHVGQAAAQPASRQPTGVTYVEADEPGLLAWLWNQLADADRVVTFNGRSFDGPVLMLRSALHGIRPSRNLQSSLQLDLLERLTFSGASRRFSLDFYCKNFQLDSPKQHMSGADVATYYASGRYRDIADYCVDDVRATLALYQRWHALLNFEREPVPQIQQPQEATS